jgi:DNA-directed RNA polymerase subunit RPC12/RpoP
MARQTVQAKKREEEEDDRDDEDEDEEDERDEDEDEEDAPKSKASSDDEDEDDDEDGDDLDSALNDRGGKPSIFIEPWRKKGSVAIWLHPKTKYARVGRHKWFRIVQYTKRNGDDVSYIRFEMFNSHEPADFVSFSKERDENTLKRLHRAQLCPMSKMIEWVDDAVLDGRLAPETVVFRFDDGDPEHLVELHAAGLTGLIGLEKFPERLKKQCKKAKVLQKEPWNENLNLKMSHVFQVVDDGDPSEVKWAVEPPDLFFALKDAIKTEKERTGDDDGDPTKNPYALLWKFDKDKAAKNYGKGNVVIPQPKRKLTGKIRRLLNGPKRTDQKDVIGPGNLLELRASMENAAQIDMPFDEFFAAAKKAGLMNGSAKSQPAKTAPRRDDDGDDEPNSDPKPKTSPKAVSEAAPTVGTCDICHGEVGDDDVECATCGATFDPDNEYRIDGVKCLECGTLVPLHDASEEDGDLKQICPKCGAIHRLSPSVDRFYGELADQARKGKVKFAWTMEAKPEPKKESTPKREGRAGRRNVGGQSASDKLDEKLDGQKIPF